MMPPPHPTLPTQTRGQQQYPLGRKRVTQHDAPFGLHLRELLLEIPKSPLKLERLPSLERLPLLSEFVIG